MQSLAELWHHLVPVPFTLLDPVGGARQKKRPKKLELRESPGLLPAAKQSFAKLLRTSPSFQSWPQTSIFLPWPPDLLGLKVCTSVGPL